MCLVLPLFDCLAFISRPTPLVVMKMSSLYDIDLILIDQVLKVEGQVGDIGILRYVGRIKGSMHSEDDPLNIGILTSSTQIVLQEDVLLTALVVKMFRREVDHVYLPVIKGEPQVGLPWECARQNIPIHV